MKNNRLTVEIGKPVHDVFLFAVTPPNSTFWIDSVINEETNEWPAKAGTIYRLTDKAGKVVLRGRCAATNQNIFSFFAWLMVLVGS